MIPKNVCSVCHYSKELMVDIRKDNKDRIVFQRCPNCGATYTTSYNDKSGGSSTNIENPAAEDVSGAGLIRIFAGIFFVIGGCITGLKYTQGFYSAAIGAGLFIWGWTKKQNALNEVERFKALYPYWKNLS